MPGLRHAGAGRAGSNARRPCNTAAARWRCTWAMTRSS